MCNFRIQEEGNLKVVLGKRKLADALAAESGDMGDAKMTTMVIHEEQPRPSAFKRWKLSSAAKATMIATDDTPSSKNFDPSNKGVVCSVDDNSMYRRPYKKLPSSRNAARGWIETAFRVGVLRPELCLSKRVTRSDASPHQHRFQLTEADIGTSSPGLQELAAKALVVPPPDGLAVKVLDRMGRVYDLKFKFVESSGTFRFMGRDYSKFLASTGLTESQVMDIWGLPGGSKGRSRGEHWLAFINSDERIVQGVDRREEGARGRSCSQMTELLPTLRSWNVVC